MANIIEIVIKARDEVTAKLKAAEGQVRSVDKAFASALPSAIAYSAAIGAAVGSVVALVRGAADTVEQLDNLAAATGQGTRELQVYQQQLREAGQSVERLPMALRTFQVALQNNQEKLAEYGITARQNVTDALRQLGEAMDKASDPAARAALVAETLGARNVDLAATLVGAARAMDTLAAAGLKDGSIFSEASLDRLRESDEAFDRIDRSLLSIKNNAAVAFAPLVSAAEKLLDLLVKLGGPQARWKAEAESVGRRAAAMLTGGFVGFGGGASGARGGGADWGPDKITPPLPVPPASAESIAAFRRSIAGVLDATSGTVSRGGQAATPFEAMVKTLREVEEPLTRLTEGGVALARAMDEAARISAQFTSTLESSWARTLANATQIQTQTNNVMLQLLQDLANAIIGTITDALAKTGANFFGDLFGSVLGFALAPLTGGASLLGSVGGVPGSGGPRLPGAVPFAGLGGGNTFVIQTFDARSTLQELVSPYGSLRRANDRVMEMARA